MVVSAPNWKGQYLPAGAAGMPANHPQVFTYAEPRFYPRRGFRGLGQTLNAGGLNCSLLPGGQGLVNPECWGGAAPPSVPSAAIAPPVPVLTQTGVGTPILCTDPNTGTPDSAACASGQVPTAADYAAAGQSLSNTQIAQLNAAIVAGTPDVASSFPWWGWLAIAGVAAVAILK